MNTRSLKVGGGLVSLMLGVALSLNAQVFTVLHDFSGSPDGAGPGSVTLTNGIIYGSTVSGGSSNLGTIFSFSAANGANYTTIYDFTNTLNGWAPNDVVSDGTTLYGTAKNGGTNGLGMIFRVKLNGSNFTNLWSFTNAPGDGAFPVGGLVLSGATLYGVTSAGGSNSSGTIFKIGVNGKNYSILHYFNTNATDGSRPAGGLVLNVATLYGTTFDGGVTNSGTVFKITTNGTSFSLIHNFTNAPDGGLPQSALTFNNNVLFGTTLLGGDGGIVGSYGSGTVFRMSTNGANYAILHNFSNVPISTNLDGSHPVAAVLVNSNLVYGSTGDGGTGGKGVIFQMTTNGGGFLLLNNFTNSTNGGDPRGGLALSGTTLYGMSYGYGGTGDNGLAFSLLLSPVITLQPPSQTVVTNGSPFSFTTAADGVPPLSYQWFFRTNLFIAGATNLQINYTNATTNLAGFYDIVATNSYGSVTSSFAALTVVAQPVILNFYFDYLNNGFALSMADAGKSTNRLWATTNLTSATAWSVIATNIMATNGLWFFVDTNGAKTNDYRFYRLSTP